MFRYYTRVCNFYYGKHSKNLVIKKKTIPLHEIKEISFDQIEIQDITIKHGENNLSVDCNSMKLEFEWNRGFRIPFKRSLFFIATVELFFAKLFFGTRTHGVTKNHRKEWYAIDRVSKITNAKATISGQNLGSMSSMNEPCKFGFSEAPKKPSSCEVRTHIL